MFPYEPQVIQFIQIGRRIDANIQQDVGDIRQPWEDVAARCNVTEFEAKVLFSLGAMRRYILSANELLKGMRHSGFAGAYSLLCAAVETLGRCVAEDIEVRQHPSSLSRERLQAGFEFIKNPRLGAGIIVETNHWPENDGGYVVDDLINLRNLLAHGASVSRAANIKGDIELLHQLRKLLYGIPLGENEPHQGDGPIMGRLDFYYQQLTNGDRELCDRVASAALSPAPIQLQSGGWPMDAQLINEANQLIQENINQGLFPISGRHTKQNDYFQLYP